ncbi:unnamed protein product [Euphydryas editha]|uniref:DUF4817 domain-containing protein n=1 Tax=Euphydryas editha TaxID=104508 RepID=A0AAU9U5H5_EUPED|nr:unnamed protein product [Euphydryas editha]
MPRFVYTPAEYAEMHFIYGQCGGNASQAAELYRARFPNARHPDYRIFVRVHNAYKEGRIPGTGVGGTSGGRPRQHDDDIVLAEVEANPTTSVRKISSRIGISTRTVNRILKREKLHPFHYKRVQSLLPRDYPLRLAFFRRMLRKIRNEPNFFDKILWSNESSCKKDGYFNMHNLHSWQLTNPHLVREDRSQYQFKINLWSGILNGEVIGPFELPDTLTAERYLLFLQNDLPGLLEDVTLENRRDMWLQHDGCPSHYACSVREYLDATFPQRWIGRLGHFLWPPRSPDLNPLDFFYWGCIKEACIRARGGHFEHLL